MLFVTACIVLTLSLPQGIAQARSAGGGTSGEGIGPGTAVSHSGPAGRSTEGYSTGMTAGGSAGQTASQVTCGVSFGPAPGYYGGMTGGDESFGPVTGESFQGSQYGATGAVENTFNAYQQYGSATAGSYKQRPIATTGTGKIVSLQARGIVPGTCMWDCSASYTPAKSEQMCR